MSAGYSDGHGGYPRYQQYNYARNPTESYTGGLTEEEQIEAAIRNSLNDRGKAEQGCRIKIRLFCFFFIKCHFKNITLLSKIIAEDSSVSVGQTNHRGGPPPYGFHFPEEAIAEEIRQRRLRRFDS